MNCKDGAADTCIYDIIYHFGSDILYVWPNRLRHLTTDTVVMCSVRALSRIYTLCFVGVAAQLSCCTFVVVRLSFR